MTALDHSWYAGKLDYVQGPESTLNSRVSLLLCFKRPTNKRKYEIFLIFTFIFFSKYQNLHILSIFDFLWKNNRVVSTQNSTFLKRLF